MRTGWLEFQSPWTAVWLQTTDTSEDDDITPVVSSRRVLHMRLNKFTHALRWIFTEGRGKHREGIPTVPWDQKDHQAPCLHRFHPWQEDCLEKQMSFWRHPNRTTTSCRSSWDKYHSVVDEFCVDNASLRNWAAKMTKSQLCQMTLNFCDFEHHRWLGGSLVHNAKHCHLTVLAVVRDDEFPEHQHQRCWKGLLC